jgi:hypothetical protein
MVRFILSAGLLASLIPGVSLASDCDVARVARQSVKALVAIEDIKEITAIYGGATDGDSLKTTISVELHYPTAKDSYEVTVRNSDCRILDTKLTKEKAPLN